MTHCCLAGNFVEVQTDTVAYHITIVISLNCVF